MKKRVFGFSDFINAIATPEDRDKWLEMMSERGLEVARIDEEFQAAGNVVKDFLISLDAENFFGDGNTDFHKKAGDYFTQHQIGPGAHVYLTRMIQRINEVVGEKKEAEDLRDFLDAGNKTPQEVTAYLTENPPSPGVIAFLQLVVHDKAIKQVNQEREEKALGPGRKKGNETRIAKAESRQDRLKSAISDYLKNNPRALEGGVDGVVDFIFISSSQDYSRKTIERYASTIIAEYRRSRSK